MKKYIPLILALLVGFALGFFVGKKNAITPQITSSEQTEASNNYQPKKAKRDSRNSKQESNTKAGTEETTVPEYALKTLAYIEEHGEAPEGYVGGRTFQNREKKLPKEQDGEKIKYQEWDVHPKVEGKNRGAERLVTGNDQSAYFTADHYRSFIKIK